jgi:hypothetical protein
MVASQGGSQTPSFYASPSEVESFARLIASQRNNSIEGAIPKFVKKLEEIFEVALPLEQTI